MVDTGSRHNSLGRLDFVSEEVEADDGSGRMLMRMTPDPRRYDRIEVHGVPHYLYRFLGVAIPASEISRMGSREGATLPVYVSPTAIKSTEGYALSRRAALSEELADGAYVPPTETATPHHELRDDANVPGVSFISVDICGSSALRQSDNDKFERAYDILLRELGTTVGYFGCSILKTTGDGFIAFNDLPGFTTQCDGTVDLATSLLVVLRDSVNPALRAASLPTLDVRVGADFGPARLRRISVPVTGYDRTEVASDALNRAVKIEETALAGEVRIGRHLYELLHVAWLLRCVEVPFDGAVFGMPDYRVYRIA
jgi:class 3 adenylate cyclase